MKQKRKVKKMTVLNPEAINSKKSTGLKRMKEIAKKAMENGNFTADDVKDDLKELRSTYR